MVKTMGKTTENNEGDEKTVTELYMLIRAYQHFWRKKGTIPMFIPILFFDEYTLIHT